MPISQTDQLFHLIKSLSKSEKRNFTVFATRLQDSEHLKYMQLFELIDKSKNLDETVIFSKLKIKDKSQFSNLKRHLYKQIMISLRMVFIHKKSDIEIRELMDFSDILYSKGLYLQSLKIIEKAKSIARKTDNIILQLALLDYEKIIESRHITRTGIDITPQLTQQSLFVGESLLNDTKMSNLMIQLHSFYIQNGHVKNEKEKRQIIAFFESNVPEVDLNNLNHKSKIYLFQSLVWYNYILQDFQKCFENASLWVSEFDKNQELIKQDPDLYMRGFHYVLTSAHYLGKSYEFTETLEKFEAFRRENYKKLSNNSQIISFLYVHHGRLNKAILMEDFESGLKSIPSTIKRIQKFKKKLDAHRIMVFYYKFAWLYLMANKPKEAIDYLNNIQKMEVGALRQDIQIYTRLMLLMAHYDLGNFEILEYLSRNAKQISAKFEDTNNVQILAIKLFNDILKSPKSDHQLILKEFDGKFQLLRQNEFERRAFIYLDINSWLSKRITK